MGAEVVTHSKRAEDVRERLVHARVSHSVLVTMRLLKMEKCIFLGGPVGVGWWTSAALITSVQTVVSSEPKPDPERFLQ